jgi:hypothetical protein
MKRQPTAGIAARASNPHTVKLAGRLADITGIIRSTRALRRNQCARNALPLVASPALPYRDAFNGPHLNGPAF